MRKFLTIFTLIALLSLSTIPWAARLYSRAAPIFTPAQDNVVISEFRSRGPLGASDEFVELYNPTNTPIAIGGWFIKSVSSSGSMTTRFIIPAGTILQPGQYFLVATAISGITPIDGTLTAGIADDGGVALVFSDNLTVIDKVGMSAAAAEGMPLAPLTTNSDQSYERLPGGANGNCQDTDNNQNDFVLRTPSAPQSTTSPFITSCLPPTPPPTDTPTATYTDIYSPTPSPTPTASETPTPTGTFTTTPTASPTWPPPAYVVISEFRSRGPGGAGDEFVELYNPTGAAVNIGGWVIKRSSSCGSTLTTLATIPNNVILPPGGHYLLVSNSGATITGADQTFTPGLVDSGGLALFSSSNSTQPVDQVGMCEDTAFVENPPLAPLTGSANQSYERLPGSPLACQDTNRNAEDFRLISPAQPQNSSSPPAVCPNAVTPTPSATPTFTATPSRTPTRTPSATRTRTPIPTEYPGRVVLNEILPRPFSDWNGDGKINSRDEYIEIINLDDNPVNLRKWKLDDGPGGTVYVFPDLVLQPYQILQLSALETGISLSDGGDTVRLIKPDGRLADSLTYPVVTAADRTWCRLPNGEGNWTFNCRPTPGRPNAVAQSQPVAGASFLTCPLPEQVPQAIWIAECDAPGNKIARP